MLSDYIKSAISSCSTAADWGRSRVLPPPLSYPLMGDKKPNERAAPGAADKNDDDEHHHHNILGIREGVNGGGEQQTTADDETKTTR